MIIVGMRQNHVINEDIGAVVISDMIDHRRSSVRKAAVDDVDPEPGIIAVSQADCVAIAVANGQEFYLVVYFTLNSSASG